MSRGRLLKGGIALLWIVAAAAALICGAMTYMVPARGAGPRLIPVGQRGAASQVARRSATDDDANTQVVQFRSGLAQYTKRPDPVFPADEPLTAEAADPTAEASAAPGTAQAPADFNIDEVIPKFSPEAALESGLGLTLGGIFAAGGAYSLVFLQTNPSIAIFSCLWAAVIAFFTLLGWPDLGATGNGLAAGALLALVLATAASFAAAYPMQLAVFSVAVVALGAYAFLIKDERRKKAATVEAAELTRQAAEQVALAAEQAAAQAAYLVANTDKGWLG